MFQPIIKICNPFLAIVFLLYHIMYSVIVRLVFCVIAASLPLSCLCQQRVLKTFPGPGYLRSEDGVV